MWTCLYSGSIVYILKGERFVIPQVLRKEMLEELHRPHMGLESTLRRARETVFWPLMTTQLKDFIRRCDTCRTMDPQQQKEPLVCHEVVKQVWGKSEWICSNTRDETT